MNMSVAALSSLTLVVAFLSRFSKSELYLIHSKISLEYGNGKKLGRELDSVPTSSYRFRTATKTGKVQKTEGT
jgi:hypothetical protein